ncbi:MAG: EAL domain-containing protein, partial [Aeromicrobium sp.]
VTIAVGLLSWVFVADPIVDDTSRTVAARAVAVAYPFGDILLLALLFALLTVPGARSVTLRLLTASILMLLIADTAYAARPDLDSRVLDTLWLASYVGWGLAALHPSAASISEAPNHRRPSFTARRLAALTGSALIAPALALARVVTGVHVDTWVLVVGASALSVLVIARMSLNIDELRATSRHRDELQSRLLHEASHDSLTSVANGAAMRRAIGSALRRGQRTGTAVSVLLVELDAFEELATRHGHAAGDEVLRVTAARLCSVAADPEQVGRLGGHRFALLVDDAMTDRDTAALDERLMRAVSEPVAMRELTVEVSACVGAAVNMDGGTDADALIEQAHVALRRAKATGRGTFEVFGDGFRREMLERRATDTALRDALETDGLAVRYHPIVAVQSDIVDGYEARVHWARPDHGWQDPEEFLAVAADSELVCRIDRWVVRTAVRDLASWTSLDRATYADMTVAVPISGRTLSSPGFVQSVASILQDAGLEPHRLTIGVTEMVLVDVPTAVIDMTALRDCGVFVSINEFGTGRTSISRLDSLPADILKIDESLVNSDDPGAHDLLALLVNAAHSCGMLAVAAGVVEPDRLTELRALRYDSVQGLFAPTSDPSGPSGLGHPRLGGPPRLRVVPDPPDV